MKITRVRDTSKKDDNGIEKFFHRGVHNLRDNGLSW